MKALLAMRRLPHIAAVDDERGTGDGYWAYTAPGWFFPDTECHTAHEYTLRALSRSCRAARPCSTHDCDRSGDVVAATNYWCNKCAVAYPLEAGKYGCPNCEGDNVA